MKELTRVFEELFRRWLAECSPDNKQQGGPFGQRLSAVGCVSLAKVSARNPVLIQTLVDDLWQVSLSVTRAWPSAAKQRGLLRRVQGRPLWDRVFVGRTLVIGDEPYVKDLLSQYVSKPFFPDL